MRRLLAIFAIFIYMVPLSVIFAVYLVAGQDTENASLGPLIIPVIIMLTVCALAAMNIAAAVVSVIRSNCLTFRTVLVFKLCLIPFYIVNFICWSIAGAVFHIAIVAWPLIPFVVAYTYFTVLGTSAHNIAVLLSLRRDGRITVKQLVVHSVLQILFVADVLDNIYLAVTQNKY